MTILLETFLFWYNPLWFSKLFFFQDQENSDNDGEERDEEDDEDEESDENEDDLEERFFG